MRVTNLVYSTSVGGDLDLNFIHSCLPDSVYTPDRFRGLVVKIEKGTCLVFHNGKVVIVGVKTGSEGLECRDSLVDCLEGLGFSVQKKHLKLCNIVAYHDYNQRVFLAELYEKLRHTHTVSFEPELSPALLIKVPETIRIFFNGKVIFTGFKDFSVLDKAFETVEELLKRTYRLNP